jgi:hypothetical protein
VLPETVLAPYEERLPSRKALRRPWEERVRAEVLGRWPGAELVVLAGADYRGAFEGLPIVTPLAGLEIGQQLSWLKRALAAE